MSTFKVKNLNGTEDNSVPKGYNCWFDYWKEHTFENNQNFCRRVDCNKLATDGAHVQIKDWKGDEWYIVPLCHEHNTGEDKEFDIEGPLVPVDLSKNKVVK